MNFSLLSQHYSKYTTKEFPFKTVNLNHIFLCWFIETERDFGRFLMQKHLTNNSLILFRFVSYQTVVAKLYNIPDEKRRMIIFLHNFNRRDYYL